VRGVVQRIEPGAVNWMSAGRGIVHSERGPKDLQSQTYRNHGLQLWIALPEADEESAPSFQHAPATSIPQVRLDGAVVHVVVGSAFGAISPIETRSPTLALMFDFDVASGTSIELPALASERALYALDHPFEVDGEMIDEFTMVVLPPGVSHKLAAPRGGRVALVGGEPLGHRFVSWNFVSSRQERIQQAEADWEAQRFDRIPGETEFIPLPARHP
jgi:redox-sensitive bicupin YhaK (pirin superfamily)